LATAAEPRITQNEEDVSLLEAQNNTGWNQLGLCTYVSATQVSVNGDIRDKVQKDDKLRWKQGGDFKHNYIRSVTYDSGTDKSIITITSGYQITQGDSSFVLSLAVTDVYYSHIENPIGFKPWFFWIPVITGFSSNPTMIVKFKIQNKECILVVTSTTNGTSNSGDFSITLPVAAANISGVRWRSYALVVDNGAIKDASCQITAGEAVLLFRSSGLTSFAASGNKSGNCQISFETQ
jgi:hypothetical protein